MKFKCNLSLLSEAAQNVALAVSARTTNIAALDGILLECGNNSLTLTGYDLEMAIIRTIDVDVKEEGNVVISSHIFCEMLRKMEGTEIEISSDEKNYINIKDNITDYNIAGIDKDEFPQLPNIEEEMNFKINSGRFKTMINKSIFASAVDVTQMPILCGSMFNIEDNILNIISVDGYRVAITKEKVDLNNNIKFIVPSKTLKDITRLILNEDEDIVISVSKRHAYFKVSKYLIISRLLEGDFIDYKSAIPKEEKTIVEADTKEFLRCIDRISVIVTQKVSIIMHINKDNTITLESESSLGSSKESFKANVKGEELNTIAYNNKYMMDALKNAGDDIKVVFNGPISPIKIEPKSGEDFLYLVLPVRLKSQL